MSVEFTDENRIPMHLPGEPLFRGVTLSQCGQDDGGARFSARSRRLSACLLSAIPAAKACYVIHQIIKLEPNDSTTLFAMRPILELLATSHLAPFLNPLDGTIFRPESRGGYDFEVLSEKRRAPRPPRRTRSHRRPNIG